MKVNLNTVSQRNSTIHKTKKYKSKSLNLQDKKITTYATTIISRIKAILYKKQFETFSCVQNLNCFSTLSESLFLRIRTYVWKCNSFLLLWCAVHHVAVACNHLPGTRRHSKLFVCYLVVEMKLSLFWIKAKKSSFPLKKWPWLWSKQTGPTTSIIEPCPSMPPSTSAVAGMGSKSNSIVVQFSSTPEQGIKVSALIQRLCQGCLPAGGVGRAFYSSDFHSVVGSNQFYTACLHWFHENMG